MQKEARKQRKCVGQRERKWHAAPDSACANIVDEEKKRKKTKTQAGAARKTAPSDISAALVYFPPRRREVAHGSPHASWSPCGQRCPLAVVPLSSRTCRRQTTADHCRKRRQKASESCCRRRHCRCCTVAAAGFRCTGHLLHKSFFYVHVIIMLFHVRQGDYLKKKRLVYQVLPRFP